MVRAKDRHLDQLLHFFPYANPWVAMTSCEEHPHAPHLDAGTLFVQHCDWCPFTARLEPRRGLALNASVAVGCALGTICWALDSL